MDVDFKKLNITSPDKTESVTADEPLLLKPKIMQAIDYIRNKRKNPDENSIYEHLSEHLSETGTSNKDKETIRNIISELINQNILKNKNLSYEDSFYLKTKKEKMTLKETTSRDNIENNDNQSDPSTNIDSKSFACRDEEDVTEESSPIREPEPVIKKISYSTRATINYK